MQVSDQILLQLKNAIDHQFEAMPKDLAARLIASKNAADLNRDGKIDRADEAAAILRDKASLINGAVMKRAFEQACQSLGSDIDSPVASMMEHGMIKSRESTILLDKAMQRMATLAKEGKSIDQAAIRSLTQAMGHGQNIDQLKQLGQFNDAQIADLKAHVAMAGEKLIGKIYGDIASDRQLQEDILSSPSMDNLPVPTFSDVCNAVTGKPAGRDM